MLTEAPKFQETTFVVVQSLAFSWEFFKPHSYQPQMRGFASQLHYKSSLELVVMVSIYLLLCHTEMSFFANFLFFLCIPLIINHKSSLAIPLCLASDNSYLSWLLTPHWNVHGLWVGLHPYSPLSMSLPSWHWAARQYFPSVEWRAWHRQFDMVSETTANQWCTTHFYSTSLWEPTGIRNLFARLNTAWHSETTTTPRNSQYVSYSSQKHCGLE